MRVTSRTVHGRTVLRLRPVKIGAYWGFGTLFIAAGIAVALSAGRLTRLTCEPGSSGNVMCRLETRGLVSRSQTAGRLSAARTEDRVTWGFIANREVILTIDGREVTVALVAANGDDKDALVARLNTLLSGGSAQSEAYDEDMRLLWATFGSVMSLGGIVILLSVEFIRVVIDPQNRRVTIRSRAWWTRRRAVLAFDDIEEVGARAFTVRRQTSYNVVLHLKHGRSVSLARMPLFTEQSAANTVALFERCLTSAS